MGTQPPDDTGFPSLFGTSQIEASSLDKIFREATPKSFASVIKDKQHAKRKDEELVRILFKRVEKAKKAKKKWEDNYEVNRSHDYVKGFQRKREDELDAQGDRRYQLNKILSALKAKIPLIFYYNPYVRVKPTRGREDTPGQTVSERAALLQDTINTIIKQPQTRYRHECLLALKEAQWAFGVVEVGYDAEWGENPFSPKPVLIESEEVRHDLESIGEIPKEDSIESILSKLTEVPHSETFYVKQIPARQFFVSSNDKSATEAMDWIGYWEWMYVEDVKRTEGFENTDDIEATAKMGSEGYDGDLAPMQSSEEDIPPDMVRIWKIWDLRKKVRYVIAEGHEFIVKRSKFESINLFSLRLEVMPGEWYPIPPVFSQLTEQDEHNDSREYLRLVRKATRPRYTYDEGAFDQEELEKLESDEIGTFIKVKNSNPEPIRPIQQPTHTENSLRTLGLAELGFTEMSGVSPQARLSRSSGGKPTAAEVVSLDAKSEIRESYEQQEVANWLAEVAHGLLDCAIEKMTLPHWVAMNSDPHSPMFVQDAMEIADRYREITSDDLEEAAMGIEWDVTVDVESMSPMSEQQHGQRIMQALTMLSSPGVGRLLSLSPQLLKLQLNMMGLRNESDQRAIMEALRKRDELEQKMAAANAPPGPGVTALAKGGPTGAPPGAPPLPPSVQAILAAKGGGGAPPSPPGGTPPGKGGPPIGGGVPSGQPS